MTEQCQHVGSTFNDIAARAIYALHPCIAEEIIILRRDDAAGDHLDITPPVFTQSVDQFGDEGFVPCGEARCAYDVDILTKRQHDGFFGRLE